MAFLTKMATFDQKLPNSTHLELTYRIYLNWFVIFNAKVARKRDLGRLNDILRQNEYFCDFCIFFGIRKLLRKNCSQKKVKKCYTLVQQSFQQVEIIPTISKNSDDLGYQTYLAIQSMVLTLIKLYNWIKRIIAGQVLPLTSLPPHQITSLVEFRR